MIFNVICGIINLQIAIVLFDIEGNLMKIEISKINSTASVEDFGKIHTKSITHIAQLVVKINGNQVSSYFIIDKPVLDSEKLSIQFSFEEYEKLKNFCLEKYGDSFDDEDFQSKIIEVVKLLGVFEPNEFEIMEPKKGYGVTAEMVEFRMNQMAKENAKLPLEISD